MGLRTLWETLMFFFTLWRALMLSIFMYNHCYKSETNMHPRNSEAISNAEKCWVCFVKTIILSDVPLLRAQFTKKQNKNKLCQHLSQLLKKAGTRSVRTLRESTN